MKRIYVASSWRNPIQQEIVRILRGAGHEVYDFRNPAPENKGFAWSEVTGRVELVCYDRRIEWTFQR